MEVATPSMDFDFNNTRSSTFMSSPATPRGFGYFSAPTSPSRASEFYREFDAFCIKDEDSSVLALEGSSSATLSCDELPETPRFHQEKPSGMDDFSFAFEVHETSDVASKSAEELFDGGKIKPIKPSPRLLLGSREILKKSQEGKSSTSALSTTQKKSGHERGRERVQTSRLGRKPARSLSPSKASEYQWVDEQEQTQEISRQIVISSKPPLHSSSSSSSSSTFFRMSKLKDFLLFRSASEGRASDNDPLKKYISVCKQQEDTKNGSFRSTDRNGLRNGSRRRTPLSPHELHYMKNRAAAEDQKRKTFLPYKQGLFGRMFF